jgi:hypothetical protein
MYRKTSNTSVFIVQISLSEAKNKVLALKPNFSKLNLRIEKNDENFIQKF